MPRRPSIQDLSLPLAGAARSISAAIATAGKRAWIVGGAPRDLALGREATDVDMASAARPEEIERLFRASIPVGRAFGTLLLRVDGIEVQHTTFRSEGTYSDARRPDSVRFGASPEEDSSRRDFTCNALYLDPADDSLLDPRAGFADIAARRLRCVGAPAERFAEDGLRLLRLARFAAALDLEPEPRTLDGARCSTEALRGVSPERVLEELSRILAGPRTLRAVGLLADLEILRVAIPGLDAEMSHEGGKASWWSRRERVLEALPDAPGPALGLAALLQGGSVAALDALHPSRALRQRVAQIQAVARDAESALADRRSARVRWMREAAFPEGAALARARAVADGRDPSGIESALRERAQLGNAGLRPLPLVAPEDVRRAGIPGGKAFGELLRQAEDLQLDGRLGTRDEALAWLAQRVRELPQDGGKAPRNR